ncbi:MAG TPA: hypothetical protein VNA25_22665 [Phycisphaerae bacterium]|nr:hypothetical protein [Phycisphaerae bacterium]
MKGTEWNWCVWFRNGGEWCSLPFTARPSLAGSIGAWKDHMGDPSEWNKRHRAGEVHCVRTKFTAEVP